MKLNLITAIINKCYKNLLFKDLSIDLAMFLELVTITHSKKYFRRVNVKF